jgi:hypothetical protein
VKDPQRDAQGFLSNLTWHAVTGAGYKVGKRAKPQLGYRRGYMDHRGPESQFLHDTTRV